MFVVTVNRAEVVPLVQFVAAWGDWCLQSPWEVLVYILVAAAMFRMLSRNRKVRTAVSVALLMWRVGADMVEFYGKRLLRRLKPHKAEQFTGDPNQPVMRRPMVRPVMRPVVRLPREPVDIDALLKSLPAVQNQTTHQRVSDASMSEQGETQQPGLKSCETCEDNSHDKTE